MNATKSLFIATTVLCLTGFLVTASPALAGKGVETRLFFGASIAVEKQPCQDKFLSVTDEAWNWFVAKSIAKEYEGFTVVEAIGHWKGVQEKSRVVVLVGKKADEEKIDRIVQFYLKTFCQDEVLRVDKAMNFFFPK